MSLLFFTYDKIEITVGQLISHLYGPHKREMLQYQTLQSLSLLKKIALQFIHIKKPNHYTKSKTRLKFLSAIGCL